MSFSEQRWEMMRNGQVAIAIDPNMSPQTWMYVKHIVRQSRKVNAKIVVCKLPHLSGTAYNFDWISLFRWITTPIIVRYLRIEQFYRENYVVAHKCLRFSRKVETGELYAKVLRMNLPNELETWSAYDGVLGKSIYSSLVTSLEMSIFTNSSRWRRKCRKQIRDFLYSMQIVEQMLSQNRNVKFLFVPNSRFPTQAAASLAASQNNVLVLNYESGGQSDRYVHIDEWPPIDRIKQQEDFERNKSVLALSYLGNIASKNLTDGEYQIDRERKDNRKSSVEGLKTKKTAVYFYGSDDEYVGLGSSWPRYRWKDQIDALNEIIPFFVSNGFEVILRHHPNSLNKRWREMKYIHREGAFTRARIVPSYIRVLSKDLIDIADVVVTWGSTVGLESILAGKPVWLLSHTYYDKAIDARLWPKESHPEQSEICYEPNQLSANLFSIYLKTFGEELMITRNEQKQCLKITFVLRWMNRMIIVCGIPAAMLLNPQIFFKVVESAVGNKATTRIMKRLTYKNLQINCIRDQN
jgi:hypothetical protein